MTPLAHSRISASCRSRPPIRAVFGFGMSTASRAGLDCDPGYIRAEPHEFGLRQLRRGELDEVALQGDVGEPGLAGAHPEAGDVDQVLRRQRQLAVAVHELGEHLIDRLVGDRRGELPVCLEAQPFARHVVVRQVRVDRQLDLHFRGLLLGLAAVFRDGLADQADVEVEADALDMAGLFAAQQVAGPADLKVLHGQLHAGAKLVVGGNGLEPFQRHLAQRLFRRDTGSRRRPVPGRGPPVRAAGAAARARTCPPRPRSACWRWRCPGRSR